MKLVYQNTISRLYEKIIGNLSNVHTQDLNDFIYSAQMKGLHQFHIILQSTYMKFSYTRHIPSYTLQQCSWLCLKVNIGNFFWQGAKNPSGKQWYSYIFKKCVTKQSPGITAAKHWDSVIICNASKPSILSTWWVIR